MLFPVDIGLWSNVTQVTYRLSSISHFAKLHMKEPLIIAFLGRSGSGKGTQANLLKEKFALEYVGSGNLLRARTKRRDYSGRTLKEVLRAGGFAPSFLIFKLWIDKLEHFKNSPHFRGCIFDGSPRKILEAYLIDDALDWYGWKDRLKVFLIDVPREKAFMRLKKRRFCEKCGINILPDSSRRKIREECMRCGGALVSRFDDNPNEIKNRLDLFEQEVQPVIEYYKTTSRLVRINGNQSVEKVFRELLGHL